LNPGDATVSPATPPCGGVTQPAVSGPLITITDASHDLTTGEVGPVTMETTRATTKATTADPRSSRIARLLRRSLLIVSTGLSF
jgi:hypothetical protein